MEEGSWTSKEILHFPVRDDQLYSIVIGDLGYYLEPSLIQLRIHCYNGDGSLKDNNAGTPIGRYANALDYENGSNGIRDLPVYHFVTPAHTYNLMNDHQKIVSNEAKSFLNMRPMCAMWHNVSSDQECQFHGLICTLLFTTTTRSLMLLIANN